MISDDKKEEVRQAADVVDVISDYVKLRRSGSGFVGLCPFHNEKTPSFHVTPHLSIYKCFGCGAGGDVFNFVMEMEGIGFTEAIRTLAERYNVILPDEKERHDPTLTEKEGIYHALRFAGLHYYRMLMEHEEAESARTYLIKRGYERGTIKKFGLGFAPDRRDGLKTAAEKEALNEDYLLKAGLLKSDANGTHTYDTFRGRLMFPIFNPSGKVIAFGGRILASSTKAPKYINSPQTQVYNKSEVLYGIHAAKNEVRKAKEAILVEGYTDVITLHQAGIGNVIATSGTALTPEQMRILHRYAETLLLIYDSDSAGQAAMKRGIDIALAEGLGIRLLQLPEGDDPDSFVKQFGKEGFLSYRKENMRDFLSFLIHAAHQNGEWDDPVTRPKVISRLIQSIACIPDAVTRDTFIQQLSRESRIGDRKLFEELGVVLAKNKESLKRQKPRRLEEESNRSLPSSAETKNDTEQQQHRPESKPVDRLKMPGYEKELIRLMLVHGNKMVEYIGSYCNEEYFDHLQLRSFFEDIIRQFNDGVPISVESYAGREHPYPELLGEIVMERFSLSERGNERREKILNRDSEPYKSARGALKLLKLQFIDKMRAKYLDQYANAEGDDKSKLSRIIQQLSQERNRLTALSPNAAFEKAEAEHTPEKKEKKE